MGVGVGAGVTGVGRLFFFFCALFGADEAAGAAGKLSLRPAAFRNDTVPDECMSNPAPLPSTNNATARLAFMALNWYFGGVMGSAASFF